MSPNEAVMEQALSQPGVREAAVTKLQEKDLCEAVDDKEAVNDEYKEYNDMINRPFSQRSDIKWFNFVFMVVLHAGSLYGFLTFPYWERKWTFLWGWFLAVVANFGVAGGVHRLWAHRAYKAKFPLRVILLLSYCTSGQYSALYWARDHRVHHKYTETDADPVNALRGFWFSHLGWLTMKRHPAVLKKGKQCDLSDILADPVIAFGEKYYDSFLRPFFGFIIPTVVPIYFWGESCYYAILSQLFMRYSYSLNCTWGVNSFAHMFGGHPYDKSIEPAENIMMSLVTGGEGWHNYHHVFPWDYKAAELGHFYFTNINLTTFLIDMFAKIGWAYDLKEPSAELVKRVIMNRGDGTHPVHEKSETAKKKV